MERYDNYLFSATVNVDTARKRRYYSPLLPPTIEKDDTDIYVITQIGDRLDQLAYQYYQQAELWWIIAAANPTLRNDSLFLEPGIQLRIPANSNDVLDDLQLQNTNR
jgi:phage tail protein X